MTEIETICGTCDFFNDGYCGMWNINTSSPSSCSRWKVNEELKENAAVEEPPTTAANPTQQGKESR